MNIRTLKRLVIRGVLLATLGLFCGSAWAQNVELSMDRNTRDPYWCTVVFSAGWLPTQTLRSDRAFEPAPLGFAMMYLPPNVTVVNPAGTVNGVPYVLAQPSTGYPGGQVSAGVCFLNPTGVPISFNAVIIPLQQQ